MKLIDFTCHASVRLCVYMLCKASLVTERAHAQNQRTRFVSFHISQSQKGEEKSLHVAIMSEPRKRRIPGVASPNEKPTQNTHRFGNIYGAGSTPLGLGIAFVSTPLAAHADAHTHKCAYAPETRTETRTTTILQQNPIIFTINRDRPI